MTSMSISPWSVKSVDVWEVQLWYAEDSLRLGSNLVVFQAGCGDPGSESRNSKIMSRLWTQHLGEILETFSKLVCACVRVCVCACVCVCVCARACFSACSDSSPWNTPYPLHAFCFHPDSTVLTTKWRLNTGHLQPSKLYKLQRSLGWHHWPIMFDSQTTPPWPSR